jgi:Fe-S-cluster-containing dehydrogenase component/DMSO reductase anchor subunit
MARGFVVDLNRCTGCQACVVACWMENRERQSLNWRKVHAYNAFRHPRLPVFHLSLACHHCERPACLAQCPAKAYAKDPATGAVIIDPDRCMGCRYCTWACPHDAPKFSDSRRTIEKCTFCLERLKDGLEPACVARCPVEALSIEAERSDVTIPMPGFPETDLKPGIRFVPLRRQEPPELTAPVPVSAVTRFLYQVLDVPDRKITLRGEWTLVIFTTVLSILVAWFAAAGMSGSSVNPWVFLASGVGAMALSAWHLGQPLRAWRALLNLRSSRLSREIALVMAFLGLAAIQLFCLPTSRMLALAATVMGFACLFSVDRIYWVAFRTGPWNLHSAHVFLNGLYLLGWLSSLWWLAGIAGVFKLLLYLHRKRSFMGYGLKPRWALSAIRLLLGFVAPALLEPLGPSLAACSVVAGDLLDRCEFYAELDIITPPQHMRLGMKERLNRDAEVT